MGRLYPRMRERPSEFRINYDAPLADGLVFAGLGGHGCVGSMVYPDSSVYNRRNKLVNLGADSWNWVSELRRWAIDFPGINGNRIDILGTEGIANGWTTITLAAWEYHPDVKDGSANPKIIGNGFTSPISLFGGAYGSELFLYVNNAHIVDAPIRRGKWWHVVGMLDGSYARVYTNGTEKNSTAFTAQLNSTTSPFALGDVPLGVGAIRPWLGLLTDGMIWSRALTATEVAALADPNNVDLRVGGVPLILPPRRRFWPVVSEQAIPKMVPWHLFQQVSA